MGLCIAETYIEPSLPSDPEQNPIVQLKDRPTNLGRSISVDTFASVGSHHKTYIVGP